jgi:hypothetical protein
MTTHLQSGQHPDADQLNAFAEHTLPPYEQQATLAHLAACPDCRAIVYLAQSAIPEPSAPPHPIPARTPLFSRWMLAFPAAAALACLILLTIHLRNAAIATNQVAAVDTPRKQMHPPLPQAPPTEPATSPTPAPAQIHTPPAAAAPHTAPSAPTPIAPPHVSFGLAAQPKPEFTTATNAPSQKMAATGAVTGASYSSAAPSPAAASPAVPITPAASPQAGLGAGAESRRELRSAASQYDMARAQAQQASPPANGNSAIYGGTGQANLNQNYIAGVAAANASARTASTATADTATDTEELAAANAPAMLDTVDAATLEAKVLPRLPSHLPALSIVSNTRHQLALDTAGTLFRSDDAGVTWQPVPAQWTGRAVKIALIPSPNARLLGSSAGPLAAPPAAAKSAAAPTAPSPTFELTTDSGDLWISADGKSWKRK